MHPGDFACVTTQDDHSEIEATMSALPDATQSLTEQLPALRQRLMRQARMVMHDAGTAEDLVQDTLLAAFENESRRRGDSTLATWATAILKNKIADWYRAPARRRMVQLGDDDSRLGDGIDALYDAQGAYADPVPPWQQPENKAEAREMMGVLHGCMAALPNQTRRVFMMREWLGFETAEIAERLSPTVAASGPDGLARVHAAAMDRRAICRRGAGLKRLPWAPRHARAQALQGSRPNAAGGGRIPPPASA
jgi:RNA polymerase sigma-70 factor (ECF subfamily)